MRKHIFGSAILALLLSSCSFFTSLEDNGNSGISINSISMAKTTLSTQVGSMEYISISVKPSSVQKDVKLNWSYDSSIIQCDTSSNWGVTIKGLAEGQTNLRCSYGGYDASCMVTVNGYAETDCGPEGLTVSERCIPMRRSVKSGKMRQRENGR